MSLHSATQRGAVALRVAAALRCAVPRTRPTSITPTSTVVGPNSIKTPANVRTLAISARNNVISSPSVVSNTANSISIETRRSKTLAATATHTTTLQSTDVDCSEPHPTHVQEKVAQGKPEIATLSNGVRVVNVPAQGHIAAFAVYIHTGAKNEDAETIGAAHLLDRMSFKSTEGLPAADLVAQVEDVAGTISAFSTLDCMVYQATIFPSELDTVARILSQVVCKPLFLQEEFDEMRQSVEWEVANLCDRPDTLFVEQLHSLFFANGRNPPLSSKQLLDPDSRVARGLGNGLLCTQKTLASATPEMVRKFHKRWFTPSRIVVSAAGVPQDTLLAIANKYFGHLKPETPAIIEEQNSCVPTFKFTPGTHVVDTSSMPPPADPNVSILTRVAIGFEAIPVNDPDIYATATLASLLGGGDSFSAGGPGKGMYTRLYRNVLCKNYWIEKCNVASYTYSDGGFFGISAAVAPGKDTENAILRVIINEFAAILQDINAEELMRAKNQLKSQLLMDSETLSVTLDDVVRQILYTGSFTTIGEVCDRIDSVTAEDLYRVARRMMLGTNEKPRTDFGDPLLKTAKINPHKTPAVLAYGPIGPERVEPLRREIESYLRSAHLIRD